MADTTNYNVAQEKIRQVKHVVSEIEDLVSQTRGKLNLIRGHLKENAETLDTDLNVFGSNLHTAYEKFEHEQNLIPPQSTEPYTP